MIQDSDNRRPVDRFSWRRVGDLYAYNSLYIRKELLYYSAAIIFFSAIMLLPLGSVAQISLFTLIWAIIPYMCALAPLVFTKGGDSRIIDRMLPATPAEKNVFYFSYVLIVIPAVCYLLPLVSGWLYTRIPSIQTEGMMNLLNLRHKAPSSIMIINTLSEAATILACLWIVMNTRTNRIIKGVAAVFAVQFLVGLIGGIYAVMTAFHKGFEDGRTGKSMSASNEMVREFMTEMSWNSVYTISVVAVLAALTLALMYLSARAINRRNL